MLVLGLTGMKIEFPSTDYPVQDNVQDLLGIV